jgi:hypothetical protein
VLVLLRLSTFLDLSYSHRKDLTVDQYPYVYDFLYELAGLEVEKTNANNLFNGVRDLTVPVKNKILNDEATTKKAAKFIISWLIPSLQPLTIKDYYSKIRNVICSDDTISEKQKNSLLKPFDDEKYDKFIYKSLLYAISKDNINVKSNIPTNEMEFVFESDKKCALCGKSIESKKSKSCLYKYGIVEIFPEGLTSSKKAEFALIARVPVDYSHRSNKICLCDVCADEYDACPTIEIFRYLVDKKASYIEKSNANSVLEKANLDEQLEKILTGLKNIKSFKELADFRTTPIEIREKIDDNEPLRQSILNDVNAYYNYLRKKLSELDDTDSEFKIIASQFQICYQKLSKALNDQDDIYNRIIKWVLDELDLPTKYSTAARIIVSFFVQNCEVFDEISK